jgi:S-adenosylmethionine decarboxylase
MPPTPPDPDPGPVPPLVGVEWVVEALGCDPARLRDETAPQFICERLLRELELHAVGPGQWHRFPFPGGVTGLYLLTESHLACHTYPEHALATFNLYCCRPRVRWPWEDRLGEALGATRVVVRTLPRGSIEPASFFTSPPPCGGEVADCKSAGEGENNCMGGGADPLTRTRCAAPTSPPHGGGEVGLTARSHRAVIVPMHWTGEAPSAHLPDISPEGRR